MSDRPFEYVIVPQRMYDDLRRAGMDAGVVPQERLPIESFSDYVRRNPKAPKLN